MSQDQLEVMEALRMEIEHASDPGEKAEYERTLKVCEEVAYGLAEGLITAEECGGEIHFFPA